MALTRKQMLENAASIYSYMVQGKTDRYIRKQLDLDREEFEACKRFMLEDKSEKIRQQPREHYFIEYETEQRRNIKDLDGLIRNLDANSQYNALVGAIRLRSDITDKIVNRAQEFGLVKKEAAETKLTVGGVVVAQLDAAGLRKAIVDNTRGLSELMSKYGEKDFAALPAPGTLHYGPSIETTGESAEVDPDEDLDGEDATAKAVKAKAKAFAKEVVDKVFEKRRAAAAKSAR
jgi:hypothetical protein